MTDQPRWMSIPDTPAMPAADRQDRIPTNGIEMHYALFGPEDGPVVLLIHGGLAHADTWAGIVPALAVDHRVLVADTRGHGRSTNDGSAYTYDLLAADYLALMDALEIEAAHVVGWSDGANIGFEIAVRAPDRVRSLFAHAGNVSLEGLNPEVETNAVFGNYVGKMGEDYARLNDTETDYETFLGAISAMWGTEKPGGFEMVSKIGAPVVIVQSEHDEGILAQHAKRIADAIPGARYRVLPDVSHFALFQAPNDYAEAVRSELGAR